MLRDGSANAFGCARNDCHFACQFVSIFAHNFSLSIGNVRHSTKTPHPDPLPIPWGEGQDNTERVLPHKKPLSQCLVQLVPLSVSVHYIVTITVTIKVKISFMSFLPR